MPPPPIPARSALPPTVTRSPGIDPNSSRPVRRGVGAQGVPTFHQPAAARPVVAGEAQPAARLLPSPELGGFGSARGVKRECVWPSLPLKRM